MKKIESGRSMIEMLGVLAIIGLLSIGGLSAYNAAMDRNAANGLLNDASTCLVLARADGANADAKCYNSGTGTSKVSGILHKDAPNGETITVGKTGDVYSVTIAGADAGVTTALRERLNIATGNLTITEE